MLEKIIRRVGANKELIVSVISTFVLGFVACGYRYTNALYGLDASSLGNDINLASGITAGRWFAGFAQLFNWGMTLPVVMGLFVSFFLSIFVYGAAKFFELRTKASIILLAGVTVTNLSMTFSQFYDGITFAMAAGFAGLALLALSKGNRWPDYILAIVFVCLTAATYSSYYFVVPTALLIKLIFNFIEGGLRRTLKCGVRYLGIVVAGLALWYIILRILLLITGVQTQDYMGEANLTTLRTVDYYWDNLIQVYKNCISTLFGATAMAGRRIGQLNIAFIAIALMLFAIWVIRNWAEIQDIELGIPLLGLIVILLPLGFEGFFILSGQVHYLMRFQYVLFYVFFIVLAERIYYLDKFKLLNNRGNFALASIIELCLCIVVWYGIVQANGMFTRWDENLETTLNCQTSVVANIEACPGFTGEELVVFVGKGDLNSYLMHYNCDEDLSGKGIIESVPSHGSKFSTSVSSYSWAVYEGIWKQILRPGFNTEFCYWQDYFVMGCHISDEGSDKLADMPCYPEEGSIQWIEGYVVVKVADTYSWEFEQ